MGRRRWRCSATAPGRPIRGFGWTAKRVPWSRGWCAGWTGCPWPWSWPRPGSIRSACPSCWIAWTRGSAADRRRPAGRGPPSVAGGHGRLELSAADRGRAAVFRQLSVFPGPFTLDGAQAVAGTGAEVAVLRLVDCSLGRAAVNRPGRPVALPAAGHPAGLWGQPARRRERAARGPGRAGPVRRGPGRAGRRGHADQPRGASGRALAGCRGRHPPASPGLGAGPRPGHRRPARGRPGSLVVHPGALAGVLPLLQAAAGTGRAPGDRGARCSIWSGKPVIISGDFTLARDSATAIIEAAADRAPWPLLADALASRAAALANTNQIGAGLDEPPGRRSGPRTGLPGRRGAGPDQPRLDRLPTAGDLETALAQAGRPRGSTPPSSRAGSPAGPACSCRCS